MLRTVFLRSWKAVHGIDWEPWHGRMLLIGSLAAVRETFDAVVACTIEAEPGSRVLRAADDLSAVIAADDLVCVGGDRFQVMSVGPPLATITAHGVKKGYTRLMLKGEEGTDFASAVQLGGSVCVGSTWHTVAKITVPQSKKPTKRTVNPNTPGCIVELTEPYEGDDATPSVSYAGGGGAGCTIFLTTPYTGGDRNPEVRYTTTPGPRPWQPLARNDTKACDAATVDHLLAGNVDTWDTTMLYQMLVGVTASPWSPLGANAGTAEAQTMRDAIDNIKNTRNGVCHVAKMGMVTISRLGECVRQCDKFIAAMFTDAAERSHWKARRTALSENHRAFDGRLLQSYARELQRQDAQERLLNLRESISDNLKRQEGIQLAEGFRSAVKRHQERRADGTREW